MDTINLIFAVLSIGLGCFGWVAPRFTMGALDLHPGNTTMGMSEVRASVRSLVRWDGGWRAAPGHARRLFDARLLLVWGGCWTADISAAGREVVPQMDLFHRRGRRRHARYCDEPVNRATSQKPSPHR